MHTHKKSKTQIHTHKKLKVVTKKKTRQSRQCKKKKNKTKEKKVNVGGIEPPGGGDPSRTKHAFLNLKYKTQNTKQNVKRKTQKHKTKRQEISTVSYAFSPFRMSLALAPWGVS